MANQLTSTSSLPWIWVVEALASSNEVDVHLLIDLVKRVPDISHDPGKSAREMVSFRILENLFKKNWNKDDTSLAAGPKIRFDPSESCEDVLQKILQELSASNMKMSGPQVLKWDIQSFVTYKRSTLSKCALLQMKDTIVKGADPRLATLKERSGLSTTNESGNVTSVDGIAFNGTKEMREESNFKHVAQNRNLVTSTQDNNNPEETLRGRDLLLAKKRKSISADHQGKESPEERSISENGCDPCTKVTKKCKQSVNFDKDCEHIIGYTEREGCSLENERQAGGLEESGPPLRQSNDDQQQRHCGISEVPQGTNAGKRVRNIFIDAAGGENAHAELRNSNDAKQPLVQQVSYANETERKLLEERVEIASKKTAFLSSQSTYSQDSSATTDLRELNLCMKCNRGGQLLVCNSETCPLVVHDSCLGSIPNFEKDGKFYCPFCAYSRSISKYMEVKKKASLARKDLRAFIGLGIEQPLKNVSSRSRQDEELCEKGEASNSRNSLRDMSSPECSANTEDKQEEKPSVSSPGDKRISSTSATPVTLAKDPQENQAGKDTLSPKGDDQQYNGTLAIIIHPMYALPCGDPEVGNRDEPCTKVKVQKAIVAQPVTSWRLQPECSSPASSQGKRKRVPWTKEEEEALKEGVEKCKGMGHRTMPWKEILEFGGDRFWKGRTTIDLKDKWRNICKGSPSKR